MLSAELESGECSAAGVVQDILTIKVHTYDLFAQAACFDSFHCAVQCKFYVAQM